jgi:hypothetical protein
VAEKLGMETCYETEDEIGKNYGVFYVPGARNWM